MIRPLWARPMSRVMFEAVTRTNTSSADRYKVSQRFGTSSWKGVKIYTKTGDKGNSSLFTGERRPKNDAIFEALGTADELSSSLGLAKEFGIKGGHCYVERIARIQCVIQDLSSLVATPQSSARAAHLNKVQFSETYSKELEQWIDEYTAELPPLKNFILPGGGEASAALHLARTICRRAERRVAPLVQSGEVNEHALVYLNRLSDFLFTVARLAAKLDNREETIYLRPEPVKL